MYVAEIQISVFKIRTYLIEMQILVFEMQSSTFLIKSLYLHFTNTDICISVSGIYIYCCNKYLYSLHLWEPGVSLADSYMHCSIGNKYQ